MPSDHPGPHAAEMESDESPGGSGAGGDGNGDVDGNGGGNGNGEGDGDGSGGGGGDHSQVHVNYFTANPYLGTESCIECHADEAAEVLDSGHWNWQGIAANVVSVESEFHGKRDFMNNFCVAVPTNEGRCAQCHIGYGYVDDTFDFTNPNNIDCLVCHDQTGTYQKAPTTAGAPDPSVDLQAVAMSVADNGGTPGRANCIFCHANAGGGDNVKHGDLSMALADTTREYDVHMGTDGADMACVACHDVDRNNGGKPISHGIGGMPFHSVEEGEMKQCTDCHAEDGLHSGRVAQMVNTHDRLACQVCHIPAIARQVSTKVEWYWSDAGQDIDPIPVDPVTQRPTYDKKKGTFVWSYDVRPTLRFHNGKWNKVMINVNDQYTSVPVDMGSPAADRSDPEAKIYPFKKMIGNQVADAYNYTMLVPHLFGLAGGPYPYWVFYDWHLALEDGAAYTGQAYSGEFEFVDTEMLLAVNHEIAPKEQALGAGGNCRDCHAEGVIDWSALGWEKDPYRGGQGRHHHKRRHGHHRGHQHASKRRWWDRSGRDDG
ncbi:tetrathionate reductase family octaheme c-type cytochrome [Thiosocius teredinicola]|uniref:tetrathionate reductase family octaheme c-type cytochrome n=1 Tax=Thiosocius teredinicola TaxID=1973002 RepID=UPI000990AD26